MAKIWRPKTAYFMTSVMTTASPMVTHTPVGKGQRPRGFTGSMIWLSGFAGGLTVWLLASHLATPRAMPIIPRVTMKGTILNPATILPLTAPMAPPARIVSRTTKAGGISRMRSVAATTLVKATTEPALRSMPPLMMIRVIPSAPVATIAVCVKIILALPPVKNTGRSSALSEKSPMTRTRPKSGPKALRKVFQRKEDDLDVMVSKAW